jgi:muramoyltetrapeptide carboxypeptidase LdcA involved in peptidoglycan recycling
MINNIIFPKKLKVGDEVRIIAPSSSMALISNENRKIANQRFFDLGLKLSFGKHVDECDDFNSSSIKSRVIDIHEAFSDKNVKAIITVIGGYNSNQLLKYLDWELIKNNPKIFLGYSDITILNNAILQMSGLVNYYGPHYADFGQKLYFEFTLDYFKKCLMQNESFEIFSSDNWSDDRWYKDQEKRTIIKNDGPVIINEGIATGTIIGGNLCTFNLLQGTEYFPKIDNPILFIEDDDLCDKSSDVTFDRDLQSIINLPEFNNIIGVVIGRFQKASKMTIEKIIKIIKTKKELDSLPVVANVDFGHTNPKITFPIGGQVNLQATNGKIKLEITKH